MPEYELRLRYEAADDFQAWRLGHAWAETCSAEYGTREPGVWSATSVGWARLTEDAVTVKEASQ